MLGLALLAVWLATPSAEIAATPAPSPSALVALDASRCAPADAGVLSSRLRELGYVGHQLCTGAMRNVGAAPLDAPDVWVDQLDAAGVVIGSCRQPVPGGPIAPGATREWTVTCAVTAAAVGHAVRFTTSDERPIATARTDAR